MATDDRTPGSWRIGHRRSGSEYWPVENEDHTLVALAYSEADAHHIAAVPEMVDTLEAALPYIWNWDMAQQVRAVLDKAQARLGKPRQIVAFPEVIKMLETLIDVIDNQNGQYTQHDAMVIADEAKALLDTVTGS